MPPAVGHAPNAAGQATGAPATDPYMAGVGNAGGPSTGVHAGVGLGSAARPRRHIRGPRVQKALPVRH